MRVEIHSEMSETAEVLIPSSNKMMKVACPLSKVSHYGIIFILCFVFVFVNYWSERFKPHHFLSHLSFSSDFPFGHGRSVTPHHRSFDVVLNYYKEDTKFVARFIRYLRNVTTLQKLNASIIVYNKNGNITDQQLKHDLQADVVQSLPNLGREGATYLTHIINNYHTLANHTVFSQAGVEGITNTGLAEWFQDRLERQFNQSVGYMPLVVNSMISTYDCGNHPSLRSSRLAELWSIIEQTLCPLGGQAVAFRGQFLVSRKTVQSRPLHLYQYLNNLLTAGPDHWIHRDPHMPRFFKSTPSNPIFGHLVERIWTVLFHCAKPDLLDRCSQGKCACYE